ncbi:MAG: hypothetical protein HKN43_11255 [Rhodothermales bacterium]|nr:hypothetical protein [Rhodothermales bacterium]
MSLLYDNQATSFCPFWPEIGYTGENDRRTARIGPEYARNGVGSDFRLNSDAPNAVQAPDEYTFETLMKLNHP